MADLVQYYGTGRRKTSVARVYLRPGSGEYKVNGRPFNEYFVTEAQRSSARQPLLSTDTATSFNVVANVSGGGVNGQADAMKLGIARALIAIGLGATIGSGIFVLTGTVAANHSGPAITLSLLIAAFGATLLAAQHIDPKVKIELT